MRPFAWSALLAVPALCAAQAPRPTGHAVRVSASPFIDGRLDDPAWKEAPPLAGFRQHEPLEGQPATEHTEVRVVFDKEAIYFGVRLHDREPSGIVHGEVRRDASLLEQDGFQILLDTYLDRQNGFVFGTTPAGVEYDGQVTKEGEGGFGGPSNNTPRSGVLGVVNLNWDGTWKVATQVDSAGWTAEFRIPFATLRYGGGKIQQWGLNFSRLIRRKSEEDFWSPVQRQYSLYRVSQAGILEGVEPPARRIAQVTPYALGVVRRDYLNADKADGSAEFGADAKLGVTPSLTLDLTYNTDFAQVEADEQQVNLTRFNLFFPEKRPFFLENAGTFAVGTPESVELFFSRRIGIGQGGTAAPLLGGGRLTGKVGGVTVGLLDLQAERQRTAGITVAPPDNFAVARVLKELPHRSRVGLIGVSRMNMDSTGDYNVTLGADGRLGIGDAVSLDFWAAHSVTPERDRGSSAGSVLGQYLTRNWEVGAGVRRVEEDFNPEVGYLERPAFQFYTLRILRHLRTPNSGWFREVRPHITARQYDNLDGSPQSRLVHVDNHFLLNNGAFFEAPGLNWVREAPSLPFEIAKGVVLPPVVYDWLEWTMNFNTDLSAKYSVSGKATVGGFYDGHRAGLTGSFNVRPNEKFNAALRWNYDRVRLEEGKFTRVLVGLKLAYAFTPSIYLQSLIQHTNQTHNLSANIRFGWLGPAGTGLFVVYNEGRETGPNERPLDRAVMVKFTRQLGN